MEECRKDLRLVAVRGAVVTGATDETINPPDHHPITTIQSLPALLVSCFPHLQGSFVGSA